MIKKIFSVTTCLLFFASAHAQFGLFASAAYIYNGTSSSFYNNTAPGLGQDIGLLGFQGTDFGVFEQNSGNLKLIGAEIKTFKGVADNVCSGTLYFTVYISGARPASPVFTPINLGFYSDCFAPACGSFFGSFNLAAGGGCCSDRDQKWQNPGFGVAANIDLTTYVPGNYTLEMYYAFAGEDGGNGCGTTKYDNNNNNPVNYSASFVITAAVPVDFGNIHVINNKTYNSISWTTYSEAHCSSFSLERSNDGIHFNSIATIPAAGFSSSILSYSLDDKNPASSVNYYRVKMMETTGSYQYSGIVKTENKKLNGCYISGNSKGLLGLNGLQPGDEIRVLNLLGTTLYYNKATGNSLNINTTRLPAGSYFITVSNTSSRNVLPVLINR